MKFSYVEESDSIYPYWLESTGSSSLERSISSEMIVWLYDNIGVGGNHSGSHPGQRWWLFVGCMIGFKDKSDAMRFKLTWS